LSTRHLGSTFSVFVFLLFVFVMSILGYLYWRDRNTLFDTSKLAPRLLPGSQRISPKDGMVLVFIPAGEFVMGDIGENNKSPRHKVYLDAYWIDITEVTNDMYAKCVQEGDCEYSIKHAATDLHFNDPAYSNDPVVYISWESTVDYCRWAGRRLPTEAEWEKAARGVDKRKFPWGNSPPDTSLLNYDNNVGDTSPVGSYPEGASPYGVLDMAGNVREWVADWFNGDYYKFSPLQNPFGPTLGDKRVLRGGSFIDNSQRVQVTTRFSHVPHSAGLNRGFRCAASSWMISTTEQ
jgi:formylglycine-generating enzyme required for sulfatase activity